MKKNNIRFIYTALQRGLVLIIMIEVHVFIAIIRPELKEIGWFHLLNFINALVAPAFLFVCGFVFIVSSEKIIVELRKYSCYFRNKLTEKGLIFPVWYSLHLSFFLF